MGLEQPLDTAAQVQVAGAGFAEEGFPLLGRLLQRGEKDGLGTLRVECHDILRDPCLPSSATNAVDLSQKIRSRTDDLREHSGARREHNSTGGSPGPGKS